MMMPPVLLELTVLPFLPSEICSSVSEYHTLLTKMVSKTPIQKQMMNPFILVDQLKVVASDI